MRCPACNFENREGVRFCESCGNQLSAPSTVSSSARPDDLSCPNCGQVNSGDTIFCVNCGTPLHAEPTPVMYPRRRWRTGCLLWAFLLFLICGLTYWIAFIPVPVVAAQSAPTLVVNIVRELRITQENLPRPQWAENLAGGDQTTESPTRPVKLDDNGHAILPAECGPRAEFEVTNASLMPIWDFLGVFGVGPMRYEVKNNGEPISESEYGYHTRWIVYDNGQKKVTEDSKSYFCYGSENNQLTCLGPDWRKYGSAEMQIISDNPACTEPIGGFVYQGQNLYPVPPESLACDAAGDLELVEIVDGKTWIFNRKNTAPSDIRPRKYTMDFYVVDPATGEENPTFNEPNCFLESGENRLECQSWQAYSKDEIVRWKLSQIMWGDACHSVEVASGQIGTPSIAVSNNAGQAPQSCEFNSPVELHMVGRSSLNLVPEGDITYFAISYSSGFGSDNAFYSTYDVFDSRGNSVAKGVKGSCYTGWSADVKRMGGFYAIGCTGPTVSYDQTVAMKLYYATGGCNQLVAENSLAAIASSLPQPKLQTADRCSLFNGINMSVIYLDWQPGAALTFYIKMPGGVPGFDKQISGDNEPWNYTAKVGDFTSTNCRQDYKERLYCSVSLPSGYSNAIRPLSVSVNGCSIPIYSDQSADLPGIEKGGASKSGGGGGGNSCGDSPAWNASSCSTWCACMGGTLDLSCGEGSECGAPAPSTPCSAFCSIP